MPSFALQAQQQAHLPSRKVVLNIEGPKAGSVPSVDVVSADETTPAHVLTPTSWLVDAEAMPVDIRLRPRRGQIFADNTSFLVTLSDQSSRHVVRLEMLDVAGLASLVVFRLDPLGAEEGMEVTALPYAQHETALSAVGHAVRTVTRRLTGTDSALPGPAVDVAVIVDATTSMRRHHESGLVSTVLQSLIGLSSVLSESGSFTVAAATDRISWRNDDSRPLQRGPLPVDFDDIRSVFTSALALRENATVVYVVTDDLPFDLERLATRGDASIKPHLIVISADPAQATAETQPPVPLTVWLEQDQKPSEPLVRSLLADHVPNPRSLIPGSSL